MSCTASVDAFSGDLWVVRCSSDAAGCYDIDGLLFGRTNTQSTANNNCCNSRLCE